jgi:hypothetical protein
LPIGAAVAAAVVVLGLIFGLTRTAASPGQVAPPITPEIVAAGIAVTAIPPTALPTPPPLPTPGVPTPTPLPTRPPTATVVPTPVKPELTTGEISPREAAPGDAITFTMELYNPNSTPVEAILGASIRLPGSDFIDDPANDQRVTLQPGRGIYKRIFRIPSGVQSGSYEVLWGLRSTDTPPVSYGLKPEAGALTVKSAPAPAPPPRPAQPAPVAGQASSAVQNFYTYVAQRDYQAAWSLYSRRLRGTQDYNGWVKGYATTQSVGGIHANNVSQNASTATVAFGVSSLDVINGQQVNRTYEGTWGMVFEDGGWKLDRPSVQVR